MNMFGTKAPFYHRVDWRVRKHLYPPYRTLFFCFVCVFEENNDWAFKRTRDILKSNYGLEINLCLIQTENSLEYVIRENGKLFPTCKFVFIFVKNCFYE